MPAATILLAGASGDLGGRIARALVLRGATVRALTRPGASAEKLDRLTSLGLTVVEADYDDAEALQRACTGVDCVVSAVSGLRPVIVGAQTQLLHAAVAAGVPRFIPSDYSADYRDIPAGSNRNLEQRREFSRRLDQAPIRATSILSGAFADMLTGAAPLILFKRNRVLYYHDADQLMDFTTKDDTAAYTADAALDPEAPRFLEVAGDSVSARGLAQVMTELSGDRYRVTYLGGLRSLRLLVRISKLASRKPDELYPVWQGMQYFDSMFSGDAKLGDTANDRYGDRRWTSAREVLAHR